jgi:hypothetical protein
MYKTLILTPVAAMLGTGTQARTLRIECKRITAQDICVGH